VSCIAYAALNSCFLYCLVSVSVFGRARGVHVQRFRGDIVSHTRSRVVDQFTTTVPVLMSNDMLCSVTGVRAGMDVVAADAKFLRAKAEEYAVDAKKILTQDVQELESLVQHRGTLLLVSRLSCIPVRRSSCTWVTVFNCVWLRSSVYALLELLVAGLKRYDRIFGCMF
jgi:hypothetical protein